MVPDPGRSCLGLEYFCNEGDETWSADDATLLEQAGRELERIGLARRDDVEDGCVIRVAQSYPVYDAGYREHLDRLRAFMDGLANCRTVGRNGLHRYNNQDHSMLTGLYAVRNMLLGERNDLWSVNADAEYHEEVGRARPTAEARLRRALSVLLAKLDPVALGVACGAVLGCGLFLATATLLLKGGAVVGPTLGLLGQYFPGYNVTPAGSLIGLAYGTASGFLLGWGFAQLRNRALLAYVKLLHGRVRRDLLRKLLDDV